MKLTKDEIMLRNGFDILENGCVYTDKHRVERAMDEWAAQCKSQSISVEGQAEAAAEDYSDETLREWAAKAKWVEEHEALKAVEFAEWISLNYYSFHKNEYTLNGETKNDSGWSQVGSYSIPLVTTQQLYSLFKQRDQCPEINHDPVVVNEIVTGDEKEKEIERLCKEAYTDARTNYHNVMVQDWWPEFKLHHNI